ncbi:MAG: FAD-binding dehydrogenase [Xanthomonadales bacterium]|nr:FAD-binding dehydrogenase [Xanthomonadales bacterium]
MPISPEYDIAIIGGGLAGITAALELLDEGLKVVIIDRDTTKNFGGLAKLAFGGMALVNTPIQRFNGIHDTPEIALRDWHSFARFSADDIWPKKWAELYVNRSIDDIYNWLTPKGVKFFPVPHWVERGLNGDGNSLPRYHVIWGTGRHLVNTLILELNQHPNAKNLTCLFGHKVENLLTHNQAVTGLQGVIEETSEAFEINAATVIVACGGINGDIERVKSEWDTTWGKPPQHILNGAHKFADGTLHDAVKKIDGNVTKLHQMWNYAAGIHHPKPRLPLEGLSLIPPKSALWLDATGKRFGPQPLVAAFDTHEICKRISQDQHGYSWQLMNWKIALKEVAVSGAESNPAFCNRKVFQLIQEIRKGNHKLLNYLVDECEDVVVADNLPELVDKMNQLNRTSQTVGSGEVSLTNIEQAVGRYDEQITLGETFHNDDQLRRIAQLRKWRGDRSRTCEFQAIMDKKALPLVAIREFIVSRKSMGGIQTDLQSRVLSTSGEPIPGLYAAGEAAGFGGGGISGLKSLEGTFISNCILNARMASRSIRGQALTP